MAQKPIILLGPSGVGKSHLGKELAKRNWLFIDADLDGHDGPNVLGLRPEWDAFWNQNISLPLSVTLLHRMLVATPKKTGVILSMNSMCVVSPQCIQAVSEFLTVRYLWGDEKACLADFNAREQRTGRKLGEDHWRLHNKTIFDLVSAPEYAPYRIEAVCEGGERASIDELEASLKLSHSD